MLLDQDLPPSYWGLAALFSVYLENRSLANSDDVTRLELLTGRPLHAQRIHVFGGPIVWVPSVKIHTEGKLTLRGRRGIISALMAHKPWYSISRRANWCTLAT